MSNRACTDELADIRNEAKQLAIIAEGLRSDIIAGRCSAIGDEHVAVVRRQRRTRLDRRSLINHFGAEAIAPFINAREIAVVTIHRKPSSRED